MDLGLLRKALNMLPDEYLNGDTAFQFHPDGETVLFATRGSNEIVGYRQGKLTFSKPKIKPQEKG